MKKAEIKAALDRVLTWPPARQEEAVRVLSEMEEQKTSDLSLSDEQVAEVQRRLAEPNPKLLTLDEVRAGLACEN
jgi:ABC-type branched-subunit amino acid transport system ATPase component